MPQTWSSLKAEESVIHFDDIGEHLPKFDKVPFQNGVEVNDRFDMVVNKETQFPINTCSKRYSLIQHQELLDQVDKIIDEIDHEADKDNSIVRVSKNKERLWLECSFPDSKFDPGDGHPIELRIWGFNSVDLSIPFEITFGYYRQICSNGMIAMERGTSFRHRHTPNLDSEIISKVAEDLWNSAFMDTEKYQKYYNEKIEVESEVIQDWINSTMNRAWGLNTAGRVFNIMKTGMDGKCSYPEGGKTRGMLPTELEFEADKPVPGSAIAENMYDVVNAASWVSSRENNIKNRIKKMRQLPGLIKELDKDF